MPGKIYPKRQCPHCRHSISTNQIERHKVICAQRTPEEREVQWKLIRTRRGPNARRRSADVASTLRLALAIEALPADERAALAELLGVAA